MKHVGLPDIFYQATGDGDLLARIRCVFGRHIAQAAHDSIVADGGWRMFRLTGRMECAICRRDMGLVNDDFREKFPELFLWH